MRNPIDEYEAQMPIPTLRLDFPEPLTVHLAECPYGCDDEGLLGDRECFYCVGRD